MPEPTAVTVAFAFAVMAVVLAGKRMPVRTPAAPTIDPSPARPTRAARP